MYITDLDNTLLGKDGLLSEYARTHLEWLTEEVDFTFATARSLFTSGVILDFLEVKLPFIILNGAAIVSPEREYLFTTTINDERFRNILDLSEVNPLVVGLVDGKEVLYHKETQNGFQERFLSARLEFNDTRQTLVKEFPKVDVLCMVLLGEEKPILKLVESLKEFDDIICYLHRSSRGTHYELDIMSSEATKGNAVKTLANILNKDHKSFHTFGDDINDTSMLDISIPHQMEQAKISGYPIVGDNGDDAVVKFIEMNELKLTRVNELTFDLDELVNDSREEEFSFVRRLRDEYVTGYNDFTQEGEVLYLAHIGNRVIGCCGLNQDPYVKGKGYGRVRHLYILKEFRNRGIARMLLSLIVEEANNVFPVLTLRTFSEQANQLYVTSGFKRSNAIPYATHYMILEEGYEVN